MDILAIGITSAKEFEEKRILYKFPIEWLIVMIHFQIDSCLWEICKSNQLKEGWFYTKITQILKIINITEEEKEYRKNILLCLSWLRNSFHSWWIYRIDEKKWKNKQEPNKKTIERIFNGTTWGNIIFQHNMVISYNWKSDLMDIFREMTSL
jgi:hypothetical protein